MEHIQMQPLPPTYTQVMLQQQLHAQQPKIIIATPANFACISNCSKPPMMLNAWTQTTVEDFGYLDERLLREREQHSQIERDLRERVHALEENLRAHTDLLSQIHATSARKNANIEHQQQHQQQQQIMLQQPPPQQLHLLQQQPYQPQEQYQIQQQQHEPLLQAKQEHYTITSTTLIPPPSAARAEQHATSVINMAAMSQAAPTESVKYTIIAEADGGTNCEPIEIELAEEVGAVGANMNLNNSTDSIGRLEICIADDDDDDDENDVDESKDNIITASQPPTMSTQPSPSAAKCRTNSSGASSSSTSVSSSSVIADQQPNSNYYFNEQGRLTPTENIYTQPATTTPAAVTHAACVRGRPPASIRGKGISKKSTKKQLSANTLCPKLDMSNVMVSIGPNDTRVPAEVYEKIEWTSPTLSTRQLLCGVFDRETLATHSMTGKQSPAFRDKPRKHPLNPLAVEDIIFAVTRKCNVSKKTVRTSITTKCADENKMMKNKLNPKPKTLYNRQPNANKEN